MIPTRLSTRFSLVTFVAVAAFALAVAGIPSYSLADEGHGHDAGEQSQGPDTHQNGEGHADDGHASHQHGRDIEGGRPGDPSKVDRTIRIDARDIEFDRKRIQVRAGETVRFVVTNSGSIVHDFTLGTAELQREHRQEMLQMMQQGMMPGEMEHSDPNAVTVPPGAAREIVWRFAEARNFEFGCNIPGHYEAGMKGEIEINGGAS